MPKSYKPVGLPNAMTTMNSTMQPIDDEQVRSAWGWKPNI